MKSFASLFKGRRAPVAHKQGADRSGSVDSAGAREDSPTAWGKCRAATKGDGPCTAGPRLKCAKRPGKVSKQGGRTIQWMVRLTAFAILWGRKRAASAQPKCSRFAEIRLNRPVPRQRTRTKRRFRRDRRVRRKWRPILAPGPAQSSLIRARWEQRAFWRAVRGSAPPRGPQRRSGEPSTGWFTSTVCSPFSGERSAFPCPVGAPRPHTPSQAFEKA